jgi:hypothetical protein
MKKDKLNRQLYHAHLKAAQEWGKSWHTICNFIHDSINKEMDKKYNTINQKLKKKLEKTQYPNPEYHKKFYPRVVNKTNIVFTADELTLLNKDFKYNLIYKRKDWIKTLAFETEMAVN